MLPWIGVILSTFSLASSLIIPEELPSLLSLLYSNIPPVKKGTDSRVGFGFRLGPHADFQVLLEVGPQVNTGGIGPNAQPSGKRETLQMQNTDTLVTMINTWKMPHQYQDEEGSIQTDDQVENNVLENVDDATEKPPDTVGGKWIDSWKNAFAKESYFGKIRFKKIPGIDSRSDRRRRQHAYYQRRNQAISPVYTDRRQHNFVEQLQRLWGRNT